MLGKLPRGCGMWRLCVAPALHALGRACLHLLMLLLLQYEGATQLTQPLCALLCCLVMPVQPNPPRLLSTSSATTAAGLAWLLQATTHPWHHR